jgi:hypothetical protein
MTPQERELLNGFLNNLATARVDSVDPDADQLIRNAFDRQPKAAYVLVQQALVQQMALREAQGRVAALEQQLRDNRTAPTGGASFLGGAAQGYGAASPPPAPPAGGWGNQAAGGGAPHTSGVGSFLRSAAATAAGVAGGAMLFQGLESLFGGHRGMLGGGGFFGTGTPEVVENNTVINDYGDPGLQDPSDAGQLPDNSFASQPPDDDFVDDADFGSDGGFFDDGDDSGGWV